LYKVKHTSVLMTYLGLVSAKISVGFDNVVSKAGIYAHLINTSDCDRTVSQSRQVHVASSIA